MTNNLLGWRQYRGRVIPRSALDKIVQDIREFDTRLNMGDQVKLRIDDQGTTQFLSCIVVDVSKSHRGGVAYTLAFPATLQGELYVVVEGFSGTGMSIAQTESAEASGIYTLTEYQAHMEFSTAPAVTPAHRTLKLVTSALEVARQEVVSESRFK